MNELKNGEKLTTDVTSPHRERRGSTHGSDGSIGSVSAMTKDKLLNVLASLDPKDIKTNAKILFLLANAFQKEEDPESQESAIKHFKEALTLYVELDDKKSQSQTRTRLGMVYLNTQQFQLANACFQQTLKNVEDEPSIGNELLGDAHYGLGLVRKAQNNQAGAIQSFEEALRLYANLHNAQVAQTYTQLGIAYWEQQAFSQARTAFSNALTILGPDLATYDVASLHHYLGLVDLAENKTDQAIHAFTTARNLYLSVNENGDSETNLFVAQVQDHLGQAYLQQKKLSFAQSALKQALATYGESTQTVEVATIYLNLGIINQEKGQHQEAKSGLNQALTIFRALDEDTGMYNMQIANVLKKLATTHLALGNNQFALSCLEQALEIYQTQFPNEPNHPNILEVTTSRAHISLAPSTTYSGVRNPIHTSVNEPPRGGLIAGDEEDKKRALHIEPHNTQPLTSATNSHNNYGAIHNDSNHNAEEEENSDDCCTAWLRYFGCFKERRPSADPRIENSSLQEKLNGGTPGAGMKSRTGK